MAVRYRAFWSDTQGNEYELTIDGVNYAGVAETVTGSASVGFDAGDDLFQPIRSSYATIILVATIAQDFSDLWEEPSNYWGTFIYKNGEEIFRGGLDMDDVEQPYNADIWQIRIECRDALGWLEDLAFVQDGGTHWIDNQTVIEAIGKALRRGYSDPSYALEIYAHTEMTTSSTPFEANAYVRMDAFLQKNGEDPLNCKDVVEQMVASMGCTIFQHKQKILIVNVYHWYYFLTSATRNFERYSALGTLIESDFSFNSGTSVKKYSEIGTHKVNEVSIYHVSKSTSYLIRRPIFSTTWFHPYEYRKNILTNGELTAPEANPGPYTMPGWTLITDKTTAGQFQILFTKHSGTNEELACTSDGISLKEGTTYKISIDVEWDLTVGHPANWWAEFSITNGPTKYVMVGNIQGDSTWVLDDADPDASTHFVFADSEYSRPHDGLIINVGQPFIVYNIEVPALPIDGDFVIKFMRPNWPGVYYTNGALSHSINSILMDGTENNREGIESRCYRTDSEEGRVKDIREVRFATADSLAILNTFYDVNGVLIEVADSPSTGIKPTLEMLARWENWNNYSTTKDITGEVIGPVGHYMPKQLYSIAGQYYLNRLDSNTGNDISRVQLIGVSPRPIGPATSVETNYRFSGEITAKIKS